MTTVMALSLPRVLKIFRAYAGVQWAALLAVSVLLVLLMQAMQLSAALLLGPMIAAMFLASAGTRIRVDSTVFAATQGVIGCMIGRAMPASILQEAAMEWPVFTL